MSLTNIIQQYYTRGNAIRSFQKLKPSNIKTSQSEQGVTVILNPYGYLDIQSRPYSNQRQFIPRINWNTLWRDINRGKSFIPQININIRFVAKLEELQGMPQKLVQNTQNLFNPNPAVNTKLILIHITLGQITKQNKPTGNKKTARRLQ